MPERFAAYPCPACDSVVPMSALLYVQHGPGWDRAVSHCAACRGTVHGPIVVKPRDSEDEADV